MSKYYEELPLTYPEKKSESSEDRFFGNGWDVSKEDGKFFFSYVSGQLAGKENKIEINEDDFVAMREGHISFDEMCRKYNVN